MFLQKIKSAESGVMLYGITPPKAGTAPERVAEIAQRTIDRLSSLDIDALVVYDVQDESARTTEERPFPFINALDPLAFASGHLGQLNVPKIIYRPAGKFSPAELGAWLEELHDRQFYPVFVGVPAPDFPVKTSLPEAYQIWGKHRDTSVIGAVTIPERHEILKDEDVRILDKMNCGVSYFISQCVFNLDYAKQVIEDLYASCKSKQIAPPTIIFTITACGSEKTLDFMTWLGIHIPDQLKQDLKAADDMLEKSVGICLEIASQLTAFCIERNIPFGFNIESVAIRKAEIEASIDMARAIGEILKENGLRKPSENVMAKADPELSWYDTSITSAAACTVNGKNLAVVGNSVGGNMTAAIALMAKDKKGPAIKLQVMLWPVTDANFDTESYHLFANGRFLSRNTPAVKVALLQAGAVIKQILAK